MREGLELGAWWEITQPHVEAAGLKWRGDHSWVSTDKESVRQGTDGSFAYRLVPSEGKVTINCCLNR